MVESLTSHEIDDQIGLRQVRFQQVVADIRTVLRADLDAFVLRETKKVFLGQPAVADTLNTEQVGALKKGALALGKSLSQKVDAALEDLSLWAVPDGEPANPRELTEVPGVWAQIADAEREIANFLRGYGFEAEVAYKLPAYFVGGLYMPSLAEHYWRIVLETRELEDQKKRLSEQALRDKLQAKWDEA